MPFLSERQTGGDCVRLDEAAHAYVAERRVKGQIGAGTAKTLRSILARFVGACPDELDVADLDREHVSAWEAAIGSLRPGTRRGYLSGVRCFLAWALDNELVDRDPTRGVPRVREPRRGPRGLSAGQLSALQLALPKGTEAPLIVALMCPQGLRCIEIHRLRVEDWDRAGGFVTVAGKGGHVRTIPVADQVAHLLAAHVGSRSSGPVVNRSAHWLSRMVPVWMDHAGIKTSPHDGVSAHALRHTAADQLYETTKDLRVVRDFLGHTNVATTDRYLRTGDMAVMRNGLNGRGSPGLSHPGA